MYTTSSLFLKSLADAGITHAFVNWGSDHPALLEDLERQRVEQGDTTVKIFTSPNEMVALSAAHGYAQATGKPAAVIVHVDVGTQALAGAIHNADRGRVPVLIYAGASPFTGEGQLKGSRNEWIMWLQDIPDQAAIVRQYMRFTSQISSGKNVSHVVNRALQVSTSHPKGPVYLWARREVMEEEVDELHMRSPVDAARWPSITPNGLSPVAIKEISKALLSARQPLIITSHLGRNPSARSPLLALSNLLSIPITTVTPSAVSVPFSHPFLLPHANTYLSPGSHTPILKEADVILVIDSELPWIPMNDAPSADARVFVLDGGDPLRIGIGYSHIDAEMVCHADAEVSLGQIVDGIRGLDTKHDVIGSERVLQKANALRAQHDEWVKTLDAAEHAFPSSVALSSHSSQTPHLTSPNILGCLRRAIETGTTSRGANVLLLNEGITNYPTVWSHMRAEGGPLGMTMFTSGGSSLGWALGAAVGASLGGTAANVDGTGKGYELVVAVVGDGSYMFGVPSSAYWMAKKYNTPFLTLVLNNGGWKVSIFSNPEPVLSMTMAEQSPKSSAVALYPTGHASSAPGHRLTVGFGPDDALPDYAAIAKAASGNWAEGWQVGARGALSRKDLEEQIERALSIVLNEKRCVVLDCVLESI